MATARVVLSRRGSASGSALRVMGVDLRLRPGVQVSGRGRGTAAPRSRRGEGLVELLGSSSLTAFGEGEAGTARRSADRPVAVGRVARTGHAGLERRERQRQHPLEARGRSPPWPQPAPAPARICTTGRPKEWPMMAGFPAQPPMIASKWSATCPSLVREDLRVRVSPHSQSRGRPASRE